jgi:DNA-binding CsgD family transcriptional regulator
MPPLRLIGRDRELAALEALLHRVGAGGGSLVVRGDAGIGKSAVLEFAGRRAAELGITVLTTAGVPSETEMAFAGLHRLLRPQLGRIAALPAPQRSALSTAFGLGDGAASEGAPDLFLIALAALDLLAEEAAASPLLLVVEDAHWLDAATCEVLAFVARRVEVEPILLLFAVRDGHVSPFEVAQLPELRLEALDDADSARLLDEVAPALAEEDRRRLLGAAAGNPLALVELPRAAGSDEVDASVVLAPLPLTERLERAFSERLSTLPSVTRCLLLVAALDEGGALGAQLEAATDVAGRAVTAADLAPAESAGLVSVGAGVQFRHPLVRAALHAAAPTVDRQAAHAALAAAHVDDLERSLWHRAASRSGPDEEVASELEEAAARAVRRGAPVVAAAALERAAQLSAESWRRGTLLVRAAEIEFELGRSERALQLIAQARPLDLGDDDRARLTFLLEAADEVSWSGAGRVASFARIANDMTRADQPERALKALQAAALRCWWGNPEQETRDLVVDAAERIPVPEDDAALLAVLAFADPVERGATVLERIERLTPDATADPVALHLVGTAATAVWAFDLSATFLDAAVDGLRAQGRLGLLAQALVSQSWAAVHLAKPSLAAAAAEEAARLAPETGQQRWGLAAQIALATVAGEGGDFERAESLAASAEAVLLPMGTQPMLSLVQFARGRGAVAHGFYDDGFHHLQRVLKPGDVAYHPFVGGWVLPDLIEAAARTGRRDEARRYLGGLESLSARTSAPYLRAGVGYARATVAEDDRAEELYTAALGGELANWPCFRGRLLLGYGRWLRRQRRVAESRAPLRAARESFDALGFHGLSESARQELRASGETSIRRTPDARDRLTPQELQIAEMAAAGLSNREIGQKLYLSHRTVESHLYRIFPKLAITSRSQLGSVLPESARSA